MASVTQANMRLSIVNGTAFVDFSAANTLTPYLGARLTISDSAGKKLVGYIKAAGSGETYGSEQLSNTTFSDTTGLGPITATITSESGGHSGNCLKIVSTSDWGCAIDWAAVEHNAPSGGSFKCALWDKSDTGGCGWRLQGNTDPWPTIFEEWFSWTGVWTSHTRYIVMPSGQDEPLLSLLGHQTGNITYYDDASIKQVLTPSSTGVTIVSTPGGTTYSWTSEESGFNRNDSSGYTYDIGYVPADDMGVYDYVLQEG